MIRHKLSTVFLSIPPEHTHLTAEFEAENKHTMRNTIWWCGISVCIAILGAAIGGIYHIYLKSADYFIFDILMWSVSICMILTSKQSVADSWLYPLILIECLTLIFALMGQGLLPIEDVDLEVALSIAVSITIIAAFLSWPSTWTLALQLGLIIIAFSTLSIHKHEAPNNATTNALVLYFVLIATFATFFNIIYNRQRWTNFLNRHKVHALNQKLMGEEHILNQYIEQLEILRTTMNEISAELDISTLLHTILEHAATLAHANCGIIALCTPQTNTLTNITLLDHEQAACPHCLLLEEDMIQRVVQTGQPLLVNDYVPHHTNNTIPCTVQSFMLLPLQAGTEHIGILGICDTRPGNRFQTADVQFLTLYAQQATIAIQNAHLFAEIHHLASKDSLTNLYNRRYFFERAEKEAARTQRTGRPLSVIMLDIDHFKQVNDTYGHLAGDDILRAVAQACMNNIRGHDISGRYGGEELIIVLPETTLMTAYDIAERIRTIIAGTCIDSDTASISATVSIGVAHWEGTDTLNLAHLIDRADQALYQAKRTGRNRVCIWDNTKFG